MADEQKQGKGIGELFVEFGAKGLPTLLKGLNSVSASFLLGKNAANQFVQTLTQPAKEAGRTATQIGKMSTALGTTYKDFMKLQLYMKSHNLSEGLIGDIEKLQQNFLDWRAGIAEIPGSIITGLARIGHNINEYSGTYESMLQLWEDIQQGTQTFSKDYRNQIFRLLTISPEWGYAFDNSEFNLKDYATISDKEVQALIDAQNAMANLGANIEQLKMHLVEKLSPAIITISDFLSKYVKDGAIGKFDKAIDKTVATVKNPVQENPSLLLKTPLAPAITLGAGLYGTYKNLQNQVKSQKGQTTGGAAPVVPPFMQGTAHIPPNLSNMVNTINITNENRISVANPQEAAQTISAINQNTIQQADYTQFQAGNRPGL